MTHWAYAEEFSGREAACLIAGFNPSINNIEQEYGIQPVIRRLKKAYYECVQSFAFHMDQAEGDGWDMSEHVANGFDDRAAMYRFATEHRNPGTQLMSVELSKILTDFEDSEFVRSGYAISNYYRSDLAKKAVAADIAAGKEEGTTYYSLLEAAYRAASMWCLEYAHEFDEQRFSRDEIGRWIAATDYPSQYKFSKIAENTEKPLTTTERNTLLVVIAALCKEAGIDPSSRPAASRIVRICDEVGVAISNDTARNILRQTPDAVGTRGK